MSDDAYFDSFINNMHQWLKEKAPAAKEMFKCVDVEGKGYVSFDEFKAGNFNLKKKKERTLKKLIKYTNVWSV